MPFQKGHKKLGGSKKGQPYKATMQVKEAFLIAFNELGGAKGLTQWAKEDPRNKETFYKICGRFIPLDVTSGGEKIGIYID